MSDEPDSRFSVSERSASRREAGAQHEGPRQTSYLHVGLEGNVHVSASLCAASGSRLKKKAEIKVDTSKSFACFCLVSFFGGYDSMVLRCPIAKRMDVTLMQSAASRTTLALAHHHVPK